MKNTKRKNPYEMLRDDLRELWTKVEYPHTRTMWSYPKDRLNECWTLGALAERVEAAEQLGYDVILANGNDGLTVKYRKKVPERPFVLTY